MLRFQGLGSFSCPVKEHQSISKQNQNELHRHFNLLTAVGIAVLLLEKGIGDRFPAGQVGGESQNLVSLEEVVDMTELLLVALKNDSCRLEPRIEATRCSNPSRKDSANPKPCILV
jgi:hypothetical protein